MPGPRPPEANPAPSRGLKSHLQRGSTCPRDACVVRLRLNLETEGGVEPPVCAAACQPSCHCHHPGPRLSLLFAFLAETPPAGPCTLQTLLSALIGLAPVLCSCVCPDTLGDERVFLQRGRFCSKNQSSLSPSLHVARSLSVLYRPTERELSVPRGMWGAVKRPCHLEQRDAWGPGEQGWPRGCSSMRGPRLELHEHSGLGG